jgi:MFS family permease
MVHSRASSRAPSRRPSAVSYHSLDDRASEAPIVALAPSADFQGIMARVRELPTSFHLLNILHVAFLSTFHLFSAISAHFFMIKFGYDATHAGYVAALGDSVAIGLPLFGLLVDRGGGGLWYCVAASALTMGAYGTLLGTDVAPTLPVMVLSLAGGVVPTVVMSMVPGQVPGSLGLCFGIMEMSQGLGMVLGNVLMGVLYDHFGGYSAVLTFLLALTTLDLALSLLILRNNRRAAAMAEALLAASLGEDSSHLSRILQIE